MRKQLSHQIKRRPDGLPLVVRRLQPVPKRAAAGAWRSRRVGILDRLRPGDVLTHCFRPAPNAPVDGAGRVLAALRGARTRGVLFDIAHGMGAFGFESAEAALADGFAPDIISSDVHTLSVNGPAYDLLHTNHLPREIVSFQADSKTLSVAYDSRKRSTHHSTELL